MSKFKIMDNIRVGGNFTMKKTEMVTKSEKRPIYLCERKTANGSNIEEGEYVGGFLYEKIGKVTLSKSSDNELLGQLEFYGVQPHTLIVKG